MRHNSSSEGQTCVNLRYCRIEVRSSRLYQNFYEKTRRVTSSRNAARQKSKINLKLGAPALKRSVQKNIPAGRSLRGDLLQSKLLVNGWSATSERVERTKILHRCRPNLALYFYLGSPLTCIRYFFERTCQLQEKRCQTRTHHIG